MRAVWPGGLFRLTVITYTIRCTLHPSEER